MCDTGRTFIKAIFAALFSFIMLFAACQFSYAESEYIWDGEGTKDDPYCIDEYSELSALSQAVKNGETFSDMYFCLAADIDLQDDWVPVGALKDGETDAKKGANVNPFSGSFNGSGFTVTTAEGGKALFGYVRGATITDLKISGRNINGNGLISNYATDYGPTGNGTGVHTATVQRVTIKSGTTIQGSGFVGGYASAGNTVDISDCVVEEGVVIGCGKNREKIGSFGGDFNGTVTRSTSAATVYGTNYIGGIIGCKGGSMGNSSITGCTFTGKVIATGNYAGGIAGGGYGGTGWGINSAPNALVLNVQSCLCTGEVTAADVAGGIVGFETTVQPWNDGYIRANLFTGSVSTTDGTCAGAIVGAFRGMDKCDIVSDNYYLDTCGANRGIGKVTYLDTSCIEHETEYGENYFDSSNEIPVFEGLNDVYPNNLRANFNRTDDPLGADADSLARSVTESELQEGTVTDLLNNAAGSLKNWEQGENGPAISEEEAAVTATSISVSGYKKEYEVGEALDIGKLIFTIRWSDGTETSLDGNCEIVNVIGFDSSVPGTITLTAVYLDLKTTFNVKIVEKAVDPGDEEMITVHFTLLGDRKHGDSYGDNVHTRAKGNLEEWISRVDIEIPYGSSVGDLIFKAAEGANLEIKGNSENLYDSFYISGIQIPGTDTILYEKDNGAKSGWMYAVNDLEPETGIDNYDLEDGDEVVLFYTDDFTREASGHEDDDDPIDPVDPVDPVDPDPDKPDQGGEEKDFSEICNKIKGIIYNITRRAHDETVSLLSNLKAGADSIIKNIKGTIQYVISWFDITTAEKDPDEKEPKASDQETEGGNKEEEQSGDNKAAARALKVSGLKAVSRKHKFTVTWKKKAGADGYQVQYKRVGRKYRSLKKSTIKSKVVSGKLKKGKKYVFRVRPYKKIDGVKVFGKWVRTRAVKCK